MKAPVSRAGGVLGVDTGDWWSISVGYLLNLVQIIRVQSFYFLIWGEK